MERKQRSRRIFSAVFPTSAYSSTQPTPLATPETRFVAPGQTFGGHSQQTLGLERSASDPITQQIHWDRAWHLATSFLSLSKGRHQAYSSESAEAIRHVLRSGPRHGDRTDECFHGSLIEWYGNEVRRHFRTFVGPGLRAELDTTGSGNAFYKIIQTLQDAQNTYIFPLLNYIIPVLVNLHDPSTDREKQSQAIAAANSIESHFRRELNAVIASGLPGDTLERMLVSVLKNDIGVILGLSCRGDDGGLEGRVTAQGDQEMTDDGGEGVAIARSAGIRGWPPGSERPTPRTRNLRFDEDGRSVRAARRKVIKIFRALENVGLGGERSQRAFAELMNDAMTTYVTETFSAQWQAPSTVPARLRGWVEDEFARLAVEALHCVLLPHPGTASAKDPAIELVSLDDVEKWREMSIGRLGRLRISQLFDIVVEWDASEGAVQDLKTYLTTPATRNHLVASFTQVLSQRLLQPGASTTEILQIYISLIRAFTLLDPRGVLIDRVARPIRRYLRDREDTVRVIVAGLLANRDEEAQEGEAHMLGQESVLDDLATELNRASELAAQNDDDQGLDWDDMNWTPDPVDAGPDYRRLRASDVIGSLISLFDSKEVFIKEFQRVMGERLLKKDFNIDAEVRVLELLKLRFGDGALQASEVMLRDIRESRVMDRNIHADQRLYQSRTPEPGWNDRDLPAPELHARILSRLFWPELQDESFVVPPEIIDLQKRYEKGFGNLKQSRRLTWLNALGHVTVELQLEDRSVVEEVHTWQASVIYAFQATASSSASKNVSDLVSQLQMDETLVRAALRFWVSKRILREVEKDVYTVLETIDQSDDLPRHAFADEQEANTGKSFEEQAMTKMKVYWPFIVGMLTNGGPMPLAQITTMLNFTVAGGFALGGDELHDFLGVMVRDDKLQVANGKYRIKG
ncbi:MAG: hypothetical protein M1816_006818 [Peltula sp. TS41687]|nr:MAG: hypothetical protein M1816_006818 [Peltula sp. TS41687]